MENWCDIREWKKNSEKRLPNFFDSTDFSHGYPSYRLPFSASDQELVICPVRPCHLCRHLLWSRQSGKNKECRLRPSLSRMDFTHIPITPIHPRKINLSFDLPEHQIISTTWHSFSLDVWLRYDDGTPSCDVCRPPRVVEPTSFASRRLAISAQ